MSLATQFGIRIPMRFVVDWVSVVLICVCCPISVRSQTALPEGLAEPLPDGAAARFGTGKPPRETKTVESILLTFTPNGRYLVYSDGVTVFVWDPRTGASIRQWRDPTWGYVRRLAVSTDNRRVAIATTRGLVVANLEDKGEVSACDHWYNQICRATGLTAFLPQGNAIVAMEKEGEIHIITLGHNEIRTAEYQNGHAMAGISRDGATMTVWNQQSIDRWDLATLRLTSSSAFPYFTKFSKLRMSPDGSLIAIELSEGGVVLFDTAASKASSKLDDPKLEPSKGLQFSPDGRQLVTVCHGDGDAKVGIWDNATGKLEKSFRVPDDQAGEPFISPDGEIVAFVTSPHRVIVRSLKTGKAPFGNGKLEPREKFAPKTTGLDGLPVAIHFARNNRIFAADSSKIICWDRASGQLVKETKPSIGIANFVVTPDGQSAIISPLMLEPTQLDLQTGRPLGQFSVPIAPMAQTASSIFISARSGTLKALTKVDPESKYALIEWDMGTRKMLSRRSFSIKQQDEFMSPPSSFMIAEEYIVEIASTKPQFDWMMGSGNLPGSITLRAMAGDRPVRTFTTRDQANLVSGSRSILVALTRPVENEIGPKSTEALKTIVECWEIATGEKFVEWSIPSVTDFALSPNSQTIALAQQDTILLQNLDDNEPVKLRTASKATHLKFSEDGRWLASGHEDTTVVVWDVNGILHIPSHPAKLTAADREVCWRDLAADAKSAIRAASKLGDDPASALALLRERLKPAGPINPSWLKAQLAGLDSPSFQLREAASRQLSPFSDRLLPTLTKLKITTSSAEVRHRVDQLLDDSTFVRSPEQRRQLRAVELLERIASPESTAILSTLAQGDSAACETRAAVEAMRRMAELRNP